MRILLLFVLTLLGNALTLQAQLPLISAIPTFPTDLDATTIVFNAAAGSGGLATYTGDVYAHTGVITNLSTSLSDWRYVKTNWGQNTPETKLTQTGADTYQLSLSPNIRSYYNVPADEQILQVVFVFRSAAMVGGVWLEGKTDTGGDIFYDVYEATLNVSILSPNIEPYIVQMGDQINVSVAASMANGITLLLNGAPINSVSSNTLNMVINTNDLAGLGNYQLKAIAQDGSGNSATDSTTFFIRPEVITEALPPNIAPNGVTYIDNNTAAIALYAPEKEYIFALGDFNNWQPTLEHSLKQSPDGKHWWTIIDNLNTNEEYAYQFLVNGNLRIADPYCRKVLDMWNDPYIDANTYPNLKPYPTGKTTGVVSVLQTAQTPYIWQNNDFTAPDKSKMVIYELLIRDFLATHNYSTLLDTLDYLQNLGVNVIELMPVSEFEGNISWGYNISFGMALDKYYGTPQALKTFIDQCHARGIAVVFDAVFNHHFGESPLVRLYWDSANSQPAANSPWFNPVAKHDFNVGYDFNHESPATRQYVTDALRYWLDEYHFDGFRFDLSKGFTQNNTLGNIGAWGQYDASRIEIWKALRDSIQLQHPNALLILEHFANDDEEITLSNEGFMLWGNLNYNYNEATMGWNANSNFNRVSYLVRNFNAPNVVGYMESHDEERLLYKNLNYGNTTNTAHNCQNLNIALQRIALANVFFLTVPGPKMIWQFGELGYDYSINYDCRICPKPIRWDYFANPNRQQLYQTVAALNRLRHDYDLFSTDDFTLNTSGALKRIYLNSSTMQATILGNFDVVSANINPNFPATGKWYEFFSGDSLDVSNTSDNIMLQAGEYRLYTTQPLFTPDIDVSVVSPSLPPAHNRLLTQLFPNPVSHNGCHITLNLPQTEKLRLDIINSNGQIIATPFEGQLLQGAQQLEWNGKAHRNQALPMGMYWCIVQTQSGKYDMLPFVVEQ
jgi:1,4-alpha-glucan branching enzyme